MPVTLGGGCSVLQLGCTMFHIQILLPRADNAGNRLPKDQFDRVSDELARSFSGVTAYLRSPAEGIWRDGTGNPWMKS